jgi:hypothetical protein
MKVLTLLVVVGLGFVGFVLDTPVQAQTTANVTFRLNTSTRVDTIRATHRATLVQVRGSKAPLTWGDDSPRMTNIGGDYWTVTHRFTVGDTVEYKFYATSDSAKAHSGWESGDNKRLIVRRDTVLSLQYYDRGTNPPYTPSDSVDVWFRIHMGSLPTFDPAQGVGVRGGTPPLDWGRSLPLTREGTSPFWSGVGRFSNSVKGQTVQYKYIWGASGWEGSVGPPPDGNRLLLVGNDTTLHWVTFDNKPIVGRVVTGRILLGVDMRAYERIGFFDRTKGDTVRLMGPLARGGWDTGERMRIALGTTSLWELDVTYTNAPLANEPYKFRIWHGNPTARGIEDWWGWELPATQGGHDRRFIFAGNPEQTEPIYWYNDVPLRGVIPAGRTVAVTFRIDMRPATRLVPAFNPATDTVRLILEEPALVWSQKRVTGVQNDLVFRRVGTDTVYTLTFSVTGPAPYVVFYRVQAKGSSIGQRDEGSGFAYGRYRTRYIRPGADGAYPSSVTFPTDVFTTEPPHVVETPPLVTSANDPATVGSVPQSFGLMQNYPNPFNPSTAIEYHLPTESFVTLKVFNLLGQEVASLVNHEKKTAGTHLVGFDASRLPSGVYVYQISAGTFVAAKKMLLIK